MKLPPLREEIGLEPGPSTPDGMPTWTLHDPPAGRFFRIGWAEFEMLRRWDIGDPELIAGHIAEETTLRPEVSDVTALAEWLAKAGLLRLSGLKATESLLRQAAARRHGVLHTLLHNYLFFRVPLFRPDQLLTQLVGPLAFIWSRGFAVLTLLAGLAGILLVSRQWDRFLSGFPYLMTSEGLLMGALSIGLLKVIHEFGHGLTAKRLGCRVPTAGVAVMLLAPVPYTDTTEAWRLPRRRDRLAVGAAGIIAELGCACWALLAWSFLPEGPLRAAAFVWATTAWILTLSINASPFMRFDGYYLTADALGIANLQDRAFMLGRWRLREWLFGIGEPIPTGVPARLRTIVLSYCYATWAYRFALFIGIALIVYHFTPFKPLALLLAGIEIGWFILRPIMNELKAWGGLRHRIRMNANLLISAGSLAVLVFLVIWPWKTTIETPALVATERRATILAPVSGKLVSFPITPGNQIREGDIIAIIEVPDLASRRRVAESKASVLRWQANQLVQNREMLARSQIFRQELETAEAELAAIQEDEAQRVALAPFSGKVVEIADPIASGEWIKRGEVLALIIDEDNPGANAEIWISEQDLRRVRVGAKVHILLDDPIRPRLLGHIIAIEEAASRFLPDIELSSVHGGSIAARTDAQNRHIAETPVYRAKVSLDHMGSKIAKNQTLRGVAHVEAQAESIVAQAWRTISATVVRESGF